MLIKIIDHLKNETTLIDKVDLLQKLEPATEVTEKTDSGDTLRNFEFDEKINEPSIDKRSICISLLPKTATIYGDLYPRADRPMKYHHLEITRSDRDYKEIAFIRKKLMEVYFLNDDGKTVDRL